MSVRPGRPWLPRRAVEELMRRVEGTLTLRATIAVAQVEFRVALKSG